MRKWLLTIIARKSSSRVVRARMHGPYHQQLDLGPEMPNLDGQDASKRQQLDNSDKVLDIHHDHIYRRPSRASRCLRLRQCHFLAEMALKIFPMVRASC